MNLRPSHTIELHPNIFLSKTNHYPVSYAVKLFPLNNFYKYI